MRKKYIKLMAAGMLILTLMAGCASNGNTINEGINGGVSEEAEDSGYHVGEQGSQNDIKPEENKNSQTDTTSEQPEENKKSLLQSLDNVSEEDIERELAAYRAEREKLQWTEGGYLWAKSPSGNYKYGVGSFDNEPIYDSMELNKAFETASDYVEETLKLESEAWECVDPRMLAIYEDEDKGVANGYDVNNIFLAEYEDHGKWQYLILVREGKGSDWKVLYHGSSYKTEKNDGGNKK